MRVKSPCMETWPVHPLFQLAKLIAAHSDAALVTRTLERIEKAEITLYEALSTLYSADVRGQAEALPDEASVIAGAARIETEA